MEPLQTVHGTLVEGFVVFRANSTRITLVQLALPPDVETRVRCDISQRIPQATPPHGQLGASCLMVAEVSPAISQANCVTTRPHTHLWRPGEVLVEHLYSFQGQRSAAQLLQLMLVPEARPPCCSTGHPDAHESTRVTAQASQTAQKALGPAADWKECRCDSKD